MRCPKCQYLSFDATDRCRNCGFELPFASTADATPDLPLRSDDDPIGQPRDLALREPSRRSAGGRGRAPATPGDLPLFESPAVGADDSPLIGTAPPPRPPLAVRRPTPDALRTPVPPGAAGATADGLGLSSRETDGRGEWRGSPLDAAPAEAGESENRPVSAAAPTARRLAAAVVDASIVGAIDAAVIEFTLRLTGLSVETIDRLPVLPLLAFLVLLNGGYLVGFTAASGQTIGKLLAGVRVVAEDGLRVPLGHAVVRVAAYAISVLPLGLGCLPALFDDHRRTLHDRLANTRVIGWS
jgi:uncharacterized RDD family membrane protein YckC